MLSMEQLHQRVPSIFNQVDRFLKQEATISIHQKERAV